VSQIRAVPSSPAVRISRRSGANATVVTKPRWPRSSSTTRSSATLQSFAVPSQLALASSDPCSLNASSLIGPVWPASTESARPDGTAQMRTVPSTSPTASRLPSLEKVAAVGITLPPRPGTWREWNLATDRTWLSNESRRSASPVRQFQSIATPPPPP
jgi:hypothetical protein